MEIGTVKVWFEHRGFGFARRENGERDVFIHVSNLPHGRTSLAAGDQIEFEAGEHNGKPCALNVQVLDQ